MRHRGAEKQQQGLVGRDELRRLQAADGEAKEGSVLQLAGCLQWNKNHLVSLVLWVGAHVRRCAVISQVPDRQEGA